MVLRCSDIYWFSCVFSTFSYFRSRKISRRLLWGSSDPPPCPPLISPSPASHHQSGETCRSNGFRRVSAKGWKEGLSCITFWETGWLQQDRGAELYYIYVVCTDNLQTHVEYIIDLHSILTICMLLSKNQNASDVSNVFICQSILSNFMSGSTRSFSFLCRFMH